MCYRYITCHDFMCFNCLMNEHFTSDLKTAQQTEKDTHQVEIYAVMDHLWRQTWVHLCNALSWYSHTDMYTLTWLYRAVVPGYGWVVGITPRAMFVTVRISTVVFLHACLTSGQTSKNIKLTCYKYKNYKNPFIYLWLFTIYKCWVKIFIFLLKCIIM